MSCSTDRWCPRSVPGEECRGTVVVHDRHASLCRSGGPRHHEIRAAGSVGSGAVAQSREHCDIGDVGQGRRADHIEAALHRATTDKARRAIRESLIPGGRRSRCIRYIPSLCYCTTIVFDCRQHILCHLDCSVFHQMHRLTVLSMRPEDGRPRMGVPRTPCRDGPQIRPHWPGVSSGNPKSTESHLITGPEPLIRVETNCTGIAGTTCKKARSPRAEIRSIRVRTGRAAWPPPRASGAVHTALISVQPAVTDPR